MFQHFPRGADAQLESVELIADVPTTWPLSLLVAKSTHEQVEELAALHHPSVIELQDGPCNREPIRHMLDHPCGDLDVTASPIA